MPNTTGLPKLITLAVHSPEYASRLKTLLEVEGIITEVSNIASENQTPVSAMRVRIKENDLSRALRVIENRNIFPLPELPDSESEIGEILVPIDFTSYSYQAVIQAFRLAKKLNFKVKLLHTYLDPAITAKIHISDFYISLINI